MGMTQTMGVDVQARIGKLGSQIRQTRNQIAEIDQDLSELREKLLKTEDAQRLHGKAAAGFQSDDDSYFQSVGAFRSMSDLRLAQGHADGLSSLLYGSKNEAARNAFARIGVMVSDEIDRLAVEIRRKEAEALALQGQIENMQKLINSLFSGV